MGPGIVNHSMACHCPMTDLGASRRSAVFSRKACHNSMNATAPLWVKCGAAPANSCAVEALVVKTVSLQLANGHAGSKGNVTDFLVSVHIGDAHVDILEEPCPFHCIQHGASIW